MENVFHARILLESRAAAIAAKTATRVEIERLQALLREERELYLAGEQERYTAINEQLHLGIAALSKNDYIERFARQTFWRSELYIFFFDRFYVSLPPREEPLRDPSKSQSCREHQNLVDAIAGRDPQAAEEAMKEHLTSTQRTLTRRVAAF
jgi:DNA-binding GntR family transcriptional regulator